MQVPAAGAVVVEAQPQHRMPIQQRLQHHRHVGLAHPRRGGQHHGLVELVDRAVDVLQPAHDRGGLHRPDPLVGRAQLAVGGGHGDDPGQPGHRLFDENVSGRAHHAGGPGPCHHLHGQDAVAAQVEERVVHPDPLHAQHLGVDAGQDLLDRVARGPVTAAGVVGCGQGAGVQLAVAGQRQRVQHHHRRGHHVAGQSVGQLRAQLGRVRGAGDVGHQSRVPGAVVAGDHRGLLHPVQTGQHGTDFAELDAEPANLDLLVGPAHVVQLPVGTPARQVAGAVHAGAGTTERAGDKPRRRQGRAAEIAGGHTAAGHVQLAHHAGRHPAQPAVQHEQRRPGHRRADRHRGAARTQRRGHRRVQRGLGGPVLVDHQPAGRPAVHQLDRAGLTAEHQRHRFQPFRRQRRRRRRGLAQHGDALADQQGVQVFRRPDDVVGHDDQPPAAQQRAEDLPHREVERQRMALAPYPAEAQSVVQRAKQLGDVVVSDRDPLGNAGGAGGVDDVGDVIRRRGRPPADARDVRGRVVDGDDPIWVAGRSAQFGGGDRDDGHGVGEHEIDSRRGQSGVDRDVRGAGLEHRQDGHHRAGGPRDQHGDPLARAGAPAGQHARQPVCRRVEFAVGPGPLAAADRHRLGGARHLGGEQLRNRHPPGRRSGQRGTVAERVEVGVLRFVEDVDRRHRPGGIGGHGEQHPLQAAHECFDAGRVEDVGAELHRAVDAVGPAVRCPAFGQRPHQIHSGDLVFQRHRRDVHVAQAHIDRVVVLPGQHHLDQRMVGEAAGGVQPFHQ